MTADHWVAITRFATPEACDAELVRRADRIAALEKERDEAQRKATALRDELAAYVRVTTEAAQILAGDSALLGEGLVNGARRVVSERDAAVADNAELVTKMRAAGEAIHRGGYVDLTTGGEHPGAVLLERVKRLEKRQRIGAQMANACYNIVQLKRLTDADVLSLDRLRQEWDALGH